MGQKVSSTVKKFTSHAKPHQNEKEKSLEKPKNENEDSGLNERESEEETQKKLGINVVKKDEMPLKMESFIIDCIIVEKLKHSGNSNDIDTLQSGSANHSITVDLTGSSMDIDIDQTDAASTNVANLILNSSGGSGSSINIDQCASGC
mgnify:CR=1 FL=1